jgi:histidine triad (HIT) family protein
MDMDDCIFCKIIKGEIPSYTVYQDDKTLAFLDINPNNRGHTLVIPKKHASNITDMEDMYVEAVFKAVKKVVKGIQDVINPAGFNIFINQGEAAGQVVPHFHCHILPRNEGDGIELVVKGISISNQELQNLSSIISNSIEKINIAP